MKYFTWPQDTMVRRFAVTISLTVIITLMLMRLFFIFGGEWAQPDIESSGLPGEVAGIVRVIEAAPGQIRQSLLAGTSASTFHVDWYAADSAVSMALERATDVEDGRHLTKELLGTKYSTVKIFKPVNPVSMMPGLDRARVTYPDSYFLAVKLNDASWLVFMSFNRMWGLNRQERWIVWVLLATLSTAIVSTVAARQLSRPVKRLADAVQAFGVNPQAPPITETGPQELRQVTRTFNVMQAQIRNFVLHRTTMLAAISHDLRTPLTRMRLRGEFIEDEEQQARLFRDVDEMQAMVDGALAFFRDDAAVEPITTFDLPGVLRTIANDYADQGIDVGYCGPARAIYRGRPFALKRAFANLIDNAIKYASPPEIELSCGEEAVVVAVRDRGPGIPVEALDRVFSPYFRLDKSRNRVTGGVGLGLTAAQAIIRGHGGEIALANRPEGGLEARVTLPLAPSVAAASH